LKKEEISATAVQGERHVEERVWSTFVLGGEEDGGFQDNAVQGRGLRFSEKLKKEERKTPQRKRGSHLQQSSEGKKRNSS